MLEQINKIESKEENKENKKTKEDGLNKSEKQKDEVKKIKENEENDKTKEDETVWNDDKYLELAIKYPGPQEIGDWMINTLKSINSSNLSADKNDFFISKINEAKLIFIKAWWNETELAKVRLMLSIINDWLDKQNNNITTNNENLSWKETESSVEPNLNNLNNPTEDNENWNWKESIGEWISMDMGVAKKIAISDAVKNLWTNGSIKYNIIEDKMFKLSDWNYKSKIKIKTL